MKRPLCVGSGRVVCGASRALVAFLFLAPLAAQGTRINGDLGPGGDVVRFAWADGGRRLVYSARSPGLAQERPYALHSAEIDRRQGPFPLTQLGWGAALVLSPDGMQVAFTHPLTCPSPPDCGVHEPLWRAPVDGSLTAWNASSGLAGTPRDFGFDASSDWIVFTMEASTDEGLFWGGLFAHGSDGGGPISLTEPPGQFLFVRSGLPALSPDGARVVHSWSFASNRLWSVPVDRGEPPIALTAASGSPDSFDGFRAYQVTADSRDVVFVARPWATQRDELYRVPIDGSSPPVRLALPLHAGVDPAFLLGPDGQDAFCLADVAQDGTLELWRAPLDPSRGRAPVRLSAKAVPGGGVAGSIHLYDELEPLDEDRAQFALSPDGTRVVYRADQDLDQVFELYSTPSDATQPPVKLNVPLGPGASVPPFGFRIHPDGERVIYAAPDEGVVLRLWAVPIDAHAKPVALGGPFVAGGSLWLSDFDGARLSFEPTLGGGEVVYVADQRADETFELCAAPIDGSRGARILSGALTSGGDVRSPYSPPGRAFALHPDGRRVAYLADQDADETFELYLGRLEPGRERPARVPRPADLR